MGGNQSNLPRASHFQNEHLKDDQDSDNDDAAPHHISISNKMVERLVEDATVAGSAATKVESTPQATIENDSSIKERILSERLKNIDDSHSKKIGLTIEEVKASVKRIELRTANLLSVDPVCEECADKVVNCFDSIDRWTTAAKCSDVVGAFTKCVEETAMRRLRARTAKDALDAARRTRHVARARHNALKELIPPPPPVPS